METFDIYTNGSAPLQGWATYISTTGYSRIGVYETPRSKLPHVEFQRDCDNEGKPRHTWWILCGKGKRQFRAGLFTVEQVAASLGRQPKTVDIRVSF